MNSASLLLHILQHPATGGVDRLVAGGQARSTTHIRVPIPNCTQSGNLTWRHRKSRQLAAYPPVENVYEHVFDSQAEPVANWAGRGFALPQSSLRWPPALRPSPPTGLGASDRQPPVYPLQWRQPVSQSTRHRDNSGMRGQASFYHSWSSTKLAWGVVAAAVFCFAHGATGGIYGFRAGAGRSTAGNAPAHDAAGAASA